MSIHSNANRAYAAASPALRSPRETEYEIMARVTRSMRSAYATRQSDFSGYAAALNRNRKMWRIFAGDLAQPDNSLPPELKAQLISLAAFVDTQTSKVLDRQTSPQSLIEINMSIMQGLRGRGE